MLPTKDVWDGSMWDGLSSLSLTAMIARSQMHWITEAACTPPTLAWACAKEKTRQVADLPYGIGGRRAPDA